MNTVKTLFKGLGWAFLVVLLFAALAAAGVVSLGHWMPEGATLRLNDEIVYLGEGATLGMGGTAIAWLAVTAALVIAFFAVVFALGIAAAALFSVGLLLISPVLSIVFIIWIIVRAVKKRSDKGINKTIAPDASVA